MIALAGEQLLSSFEWRHKVHLVNEEMRQEISGDDGPQILERIAVAAVLARMPVDRVDAMSRFYSLMPALEIANEREFRDGAALTAISHVGGALSDVEKARVLEAVETLRRDEAEILSFARLAEEAMRQLGISVGDYRSLAGGVSRLCDGRNAGNFDFPESPVIE